MPCVLVVWGGVVCRGVMVCGVMVCGDMLLLFCVAVSYLVVMW